jgi:hypothetical protein
LNLTKFSQHNFKTTKQIILKLITKTQNIPQLLFLLKKIITIIQQNKQVKINLKYLLKYF